MLKELVYAGMVQRAGRTLRRGCMPAAAQDLGRLMDVTQARISHPLPTHIMLPLLLPPMV